MNPSIVSLCARSYDPLGAVLLKNTVAFQLEILRRVTRTATLDGECAIYDGGSTVADSSIKLIAKNPSFALAESAMRLFSVWPRVSLAIVSGCYEAVPESARMVDSDLVLSLMIVRSL